MAPRVGADIDWSTFPESDGEPMAENLDNAVQMIDLQWTLQTLFARQGRAGTTTVGGNQFVYYNRFNGRDNISPDVYVAFDRPPPGPNKWQTWVEGKFPDIVFEITSPSTQARDLSTAQGGKRDVPRDDIPGQMPARLGMLMAGEPAATKSTATASTTASEEQTDDESPIQPARPLRTRYRRRRDRLRHLRADAAAGWGRPAATGADCPRFAR